jgi:hypothetical protein
MGNFIMKAEDFLRVIKYLGSNYLVAGRHRLGLTGTVYTLARHYSQTTNFGTKGPMAAA